MLRLGGKSTPRTESLSLFGISRSGPRSRRAPGDWSIIDGLKVELQELTDRLRAASQAFMTSGGHHALLDYLEFEGPDHFDAFTIPSSDDDMTTVGRGGRNAGPTYLIERWISGQDAGVFRQASNVRDAMSIWKIPKSERTKLLAGWKDELLKEQVATIQGLVVRYENCLAELDAKFDDSNREIIASRQIIGCTTTAAAKYRDALNEAQPGVLLVEEAGEILEAHVLTALSRSTKQLILIGDHK